MALGRRNQKGALLNPPTINDIDDREPSLDWSPRLLGLRDKPIAALTDEELRLAIVNEWALGRVMPLALDVIEKAPATGRRFLGPSLLASVISVAYKFWAAHPQWWARAHKVLENEITAWSELPNSERSALMDGEEARLWKRLATKELPSVLP
jgi:hypothetical protein